MRIAFGVLVAALCVSSTCLSQSNSITTKITTPVQPIVASDLGTKPDASEIDKTAEPYQSGKLLASDAKTLVANLGGKDTTTIIHVLRWGDAGHTKLMFDKWYVYDPSKSKTSFYLPPSAAFTGTSIPGRTDFQLIYYSI